VYARKVADAHGREVEREHQVFVEAAKVIADTRLKPQERRRESFRFPIARGASANVRAQLWYEYSPLAEPEYRTKVVFLSLAQFAPAEAASQR
jgi:hypothetical protein